MDTLKLSLSSQEADLLAQALDVYATTLMCAPLGLGLELMVAVRGLRGRLDEACSLNHAAHAAVEDVEGNVLQFARA